MAAPINLVLSTRNPNKVREIHAIMTDLPVELITLDAYPDAPEVIEDKKTLDENATKKSQTLFDHTGLPTMADDTGLEVLALDGAPGVHSARYAGENPTGCCWTPTKQGEPHPTDAIVTNILRSLPSKTSLDSSNLESSHPCSQLTPRAI